MTNQLYNKGREGFLDGSIDWDTDNIKAILVDNSYSFSNAHDMRDDIVSANELTTGGTSGNLSSKTVTDGVADAANITFTAVTNTPPTDDVSAIILFKDTGTPSTSRLIAYIDTATGLPFDASGGDVTVAWDDGTNRIFKL